MLIIFCRVSGSRAWKSQTLRLSSCTSFTVSRFFFAYAVAKRWYFPISNPMWALVDWSFSFDLQGSLLNLNCFLEYRHQSHQSHQKSCLFSLWLHDAILARYLLFRVFVSSSVCHKLPVLYRNSMDESSWFLTRKLASTYPTCRKFGCLQKWGYFPLSRSPDLENFATASRSRCQQKSSTVELLTTATTVDASWLFTARRPTNSTVVNLLYNLFRLWVVQQLSRFQLT